MVPNKAYPFQKVLTILKNKKLGMIKEDEKTAYVFLLNQVKSIVNDKNKTRLAMRIIKVMSKELYVLSYDNGKNNVLKLINDEI